MTETCVSTDIEQELTPIVQVCENVFVGAGIHAKQFSPQFQDHNIGLVINCSSEYVYLQHPKCLAKIVHIPIKPADPISFLDVIDDLVEIIDKGREKGINVFLHSNESLSRAPAVAIYYLMMFCQLGFYDSLAILEDNLEIDIDPELIDVIGIFQED